MGRLLALLPALAVLVLPATSGATWSAAAAGTAHSAAASMTNASDFRARCTTRAWRSSVTLSWTVSPDVFVERYEIVRNATAGGHDDVIHVPRAVASVTDEVPPGEGISYTYTIRAESGARTWTTPVLAAVGRPTYDRRSCTTV